MSVIVLEGTCDGGLTMLSERRPMRYLLFIDESGNTGDISISDDLIWNYGNQDYFALGGLYVAENQLEELETKLSCILGDYGLGVGLKELKSTANYPFDRELKTRLNEALLGNDVRAFFDLSNKKYKIIIKIVELCIYPYFLYGELPFDTEKRLKHKICANYCYNHLPDETIKEYIDLCNRHKNTDKAFSQYLCFLERLKKEIISEEYNTQIGKVIDAVKSKGKYFIATHNIFPVEDCTNKGRKLYFLPNTDAFNNLSAHIKNIELCTDDELLIIHDNQAQFSDVVEKWANELVTTYSINIHLPVVFRDSKTSNMLMTVDYYTGCLLHMYKNIIERNYSTTNEQYNFLVPWLEHVNVVDSPKSRNFFRTMGMVQKASDIPIVL